MDLIVLVRPHHGGGRPPAQHNGALEHAPLVREPKHVGLALARGICSFLEGR